MVGLVLGTGKTKTREGPFLKDGRTKKAECLCPRRSGKDGGFGFRHQLCEERTLSVLLTPHGAQNLADGGAPWKCKE